MLRSYRSPLCEDVLKRDIGVGQGTVERKLDGVGDFVLDLLVDRVEVGLGNVEFGLEFTSRSGKRIAFAPFFEFVRCEFLLW